VIRGARRPLIIAGGGVLYSEAQDALRRLAEGTGIPVADTQAGKGALAWDHPQAVGGVGSTGTAPANALAGADVLRTRTIEEFRVALGKAREASRTTVVYIKTDPLAPVPSSESWWDVPVAQTAALDSTRAARESYTRAQQVVGLGHGAVLDAGGHPPAGHIQPHRGQAEPALDGPLHPADALHLLQRDPGRRAAQPAVAGHQVVVVTAPGQEVVHQRCLPPGMPGRPFRRRWRSADHLGEHVLHVRAGPHRDERAQPAALRTVLPPLARPGHVDLESAPAARPPHQGLDQAHGLDAPGADRFRGGLHEPRAGLQENLGCGATSPGPHCHRSSSG